MMFNSRKPHRFQHTPIYIDERRDRLATLEQRCRRELGMDISKEPMVNESTELGKDSNRKIAMDTHMNADNIRVHCDDFQYTFSQAVHHSRRNKQRMGLFSFSLPVMVILLVALVSVLYYLLAR